MAKNLKETIAPYLKKIGMEDEKLAALFNADGTELSDNAEAELSQFDAMRIKKIQTTSKTEGFDQGHKKGLAEGASKWEKEAQEEFELTSEKKGIELIREIVDKKSTQKTELEEDKVKSHPLFIKTKREFEKTLSEKTSEWENKYNQRESEIQKEKTFNSIVTKAKTIIPSLKPILPKDAAKAERQMNFLVNELKGYEYKDVDGQIVVMKDGKPYEDKHGKTIDIETLVKSHAESIWEFESGQQRSGAGNNNDGGNAGSGNSKLNVKAPTNENEFVTAMKSAKSAEERIAISDAYKEQKSKAEVGAQ